MSQIRVTAKNVNSNNSARRITLKDVARQAGVSVMTVSRALREDAPVAPLSRARIRKLAIQLGYRPDPQLSALVAYRHRIRPPAERTVLAYLTADETRSGFREIPIARDAFTGAAARGEETGYRIEPIWFRDLTKRHRDPSAVLRARGIRGLILARMPSVDTQLGLNWAEFSCVAVGYSLQELVFHTVASHLFQDMTLAFEQALAHGYRRPALLLAPELDRRTQHQFHGAFLSCQCSLPPKNRLPVLWSAEEVRAEDLGPYIARHAPDVLISTWRLARRSLSRLGLAPPRDIGFVDTCVENPDGAIAGVFQDFQKIGRAAVDRLNLLLQIGERGAPAKPEVTALYGEWVPGRTVNPPVVAPCSNGRVRLQK